MFCVFLSFLLCVALRTYSLVSNDTFTNILYKHLFFFCKMFNLKKSKVSWTKSLFFDIIYL